MHRPAFASPVVASIALLAWMLGFAVPAAALPSADYRIAPVPAWIAAVERGVANPDVLEQVSGGAYYLLVDTQLSTSRSARTAYRRMAINAINAQGLQTIANVEITFDPSFQTLQLHTLDVIRDGTTIDKLGRASVRILQRESDLERRIYDGRKTASIFLDDVRVGDTVDYAYSVTGRNPAFGEHDSGAFALQYSVPVARIHARLSTNEPQRMRLSPRHTTIAPSVVDDAGMRSWTWRATDTSARVPDSGEPGWHDPSAAIGWSTYADWAAVADWALPMYEVAQSIDAPLRAEIDRIASVATTPGERLRAVLQFVQGEIRYLGIEVGSGSYVPSPPALVLERRFGDCKDKTLLMLTMLDALGIDANAALVATDARRALHARLPSPSQFDHVIVRARIDDASYWLDPTRQTQKAELANIVQADFDLALVVARGSRALTSMKSSTPLVSKRDVYVTIDASEGFEQPVQIKVVTVATGERAESLRQSLATTNRDELQKGYLNFYASYYPGIEMASALVVEDDEAANRVRTTERYVVKDFTTHDEGDARHSATLWTPDIDDMLRAPDSISRDAPLWRQHPLDVTVTTETLLAGTWSLEPEKITVDDHAFAYERVITPSPGKLRMVDRFTTRTDEVAAAATVAYAANLARARDSSSYALSWPNPSAAAINGNAGASFNWILVLFALMAAIISIGLGVLLWRFDPKPIGDAQPYAPKGISGWLALPAIGVAIMPIVIAFTAISESDGFSHSAWTTLTTPGGDAYDPAWAPFILFSVFSVIWMLVHSIVLAVVFFQQRSSAPYVYIALMLGFMLVAVVNALAIVHLRVADMQKDVVADVVRSVLSGVIWSSYFLRSQRVRATFVRRRRTRHEAPVPAAPPRLLID